MVSTLNLDEKYNRVRRNFCFYLDIQDHGLARSLSRRIQDVGLQQEVFLTSRVSHVVRERAGGGEAAQAPCARREGRRADAMLERVRASHHPHQHTYVTLSVQKAINLLDRLYDTFFTASRKTHVRLFTKHYIKIEFLDKLCRPVYKEFDEWPAISLDPDPPKEKQETKETEKLTTAQSHNITNTTHKMTRKSRPRTKEKEEKEPKGGYCEICNSEYLEAGAHRRSARHLAFVRDAGNYLALDSLIGAGADVAAFLQRAAPVNGERRSRRHACNGEPAGARSRSRSRSRSRPRRNGTLEARRRDNDHYYKVVGVSTKLRSSGGFKRKESPPRVNGAEPLVVKFRKVRRSELSVLSDEAEQFMFPRRASSSSDDEDEEPPPPAPAPRSPARPPPRRQARPTALKEESSEEDAWPEEARKRRRRAPARRARRAPPDPPPVPEPEPEPESVPEPPPAPAPAPAPPPPPAPAPATAPAPPAEESERCMRWEDGRLKYSAAVERLQFSFESVPRTEPWYQSFTRQDRDEPPARDVPGYFELYSNPSPKLPYEMGQLPPLKPNCCPLSELVRRREEKAGAVRSYGTRGTARRKGRQRAAPLTAPAGRPRKSPREHASTLAILGSAGLLARRRRADDAASTASEDTASDAHTQPPPEPATGGARDRAECLQRLLREVFSEAEVEECAPGGADLTPASNQPDLSSLVSESDACQLLRDEARADIEPESAASPGSADSARAATCAPGREDSAPDDSDDTATDRDRSENESRDGNSSPADTVSESMDTASSDRLLAELQAAPDEERPPRRRRGRRARGGRSSGSEEERELRKKRRALAGLCRWVPVVRVARVDPAAARARSLRSGARATTRAATAR